MMYSRLYGNEINFMSLLTSLFDEIIRNNLYVIHYAHSTVNTVWIISLCVETVSTVDLIYQEK